MAAFVPPKHPASQRKTGKVEKVDPDQILEAKFFLSIDVLCLDCWFIPAFVVSHF